MAPPIEQTLRLIERAQNNDDAALNELFERYLGRVRRIAALRLGRTHHELLDVDDITQEAMTDAFRGLDRFDVETDGKFCNWLATVVENRIRMALRAGAAQKRGGGVVRRFADAAATVRASEIGGGAATPSQHAMANELGDRMESGLLRIPERYREVIIHRYFCQMPYDEIAEAMGLTPVNVRSLYARALRELKRYLPGNGTRPAQ